MEALTDEGSFSSNGDTRWNVALKLHIACTNECTVRPYFKSPTQAIFILRLSTPFRAAPTALCGKVRLYERLFTAESPGADGTDYLTQLDPNSLKEGEALMEPALADLPVGGTVQFERQGYFCKDPDSTEACAVFNRTVALKDSWAKKQGK